MTDGVQIKHIQTGSLRIATRVIGGPNAGTYFVHLPGSAAPSVTRSLLEDMRAARLPGAFVLIISWEVLVSVAEEILYRGVIYGALRQYVSVGVALPVGSLMFALGHGRWDNIVFLFAAGCVLTYLYEWKASLYLLILVHLSVQVGHVLYIAMT